jgi:hypothetical protein
MTRTQQLIKLIRSGTHRIDTVYGLCKWIDSRKEWIYSDCGFRKDVIKRATKATLLNQGETA